MRKSHFTLPRSPFLAAALGAIALLAGVLAPNASAGAYDVNVCTETGATDAFRIMGEPGTEGLEAQNTCGVPGQPRLLLLAQANTIVRRSLTATLQAPDDTFIEKLKAVRATGPDWPTDQIVWGLSTGSGRVLEQISARRLEENVSFDINSTSVIASLRCIQINCQLGATRPLVAMRAIVATIVDITPPEVDIPNVPELEAPVKGTVTIPFRATDLGGGIASTFLFVDGAPVATREETNEGRCSTPYRFLVPCALALDRTFLLDTTRLSDGPHTVQVRAADAGNLDKVSRDVRLTVDNTPTTAPPADPPTTPAPSTTPPKTGSGMRVPPRLSSLSLSRKSVAAGKRLQLRFAASEAGTLSVAIAPMAGAAARGKAAKPLSTLTRTVAAGPGAIPIATRVRGRLLRPGAYGVTVSLRKADGSSSERATLRFRVLRQR
ncbi:MAG TPA: hypothetical protein VMS60_15185 [Solirubrobacterales bacterium]|nr:hypothetical protein [Solirubrobacterales bacterium]